MLFIEKGAKVKLPKQYHFVNNACATLYDQIVEILSESYYSEMRETTVEFGEDKELREIFIENKVHAIDALKSAQRNDDLEIILAKHIVMSVITDMLNFIYESISIAQKGKMSVAYALIRKPFTDQLLILEQILNDKTDFINRFFHKGNPEDYDPNSKKLNKKEIINKAFSKDKSNLFTPEWIYELRYDKASKLGINLGYQITLFIL